jgi:hypothetical protein
MCSFPTLPVPTFHPLRSTMTTQHCLLSTGCPWVSPPITPIPFVPTRCVSVTSHHTHAFRPDAACADLPSFAFHHDHTSLPSVPILSMSVTSHHTHAFRPNAACADFPSFAFRHDHHTSLPSVPTLSVSVASNHTPAFRLHNTACECHPPSPPCLPSRLCLPSQYCR